MSLTLFECFRCFKMVFFIYMCIILCQTLLFSQFILHSQDPSSWNPLKVVSCQRKSDKTDIWKSNQRSPTIHPSALSSFVLLLVAFFCLLNTLCPLYAFVLFIYLFCMPAVLSHMWKSTDYVSKCTFTVTCLSVTWIQKEKHTHNIFTFLPCAFTLYTCQRCSHVYLHLACHSMKWVQWFVEEAAHPHYFVRLK